MPRDLEQIRPTDTVCRVFIQYVKDNIALSNDPRDDQPSYPKGPMIPGKDGLSLDEMNLLRGMIRTGKLKVDPPSGLNDVMKGLDDD